MDRLNGLSLFHHVRQAATRRLSRVRTRGLREHGLEVNPWLSGLPMELRLMASSMEVRAEPSIIVRDNPIELSLRSQRERGYMPISFARVATTYSYRGPKNRLVSHIVPGEKYSFQDFETYLREYEESHFALSPKKAGWETMRTLEALSVGCMPILELENLGRFSLAWHPVGLYQEIFRSLVNTWLPPDAEIVRQIIDHANRFLTSEGQVQTLYRLIGETVPVGTASIISVGLSSPDYLEASLLHGLSKHLGERLRYSRISESYWADSQSSDLGHGLGFGYTRFMDGLPHEYDDRSLNSSDVIFLTRAERYGKAIIHAVRRQRELSPSSKLVVIFGGDRAPDFAIDSKNFGENVYVFCRESPL